MIYLDNAATTFPKPQIVIDEMTRCMQEYCANPGRGGHQLSIASSRAVMESRELVAKHFNITNPSRISFTKNATESINIALKGFLEEGDHVITTSMEHNSVIRPLKGLEAHGKIKLTIVDCDDFGNLDSKKVEMAINADTRLIVSTLSSNVNGIIMPITEIGDICKKHNVYFMLDASQGAGSLRIDVEEMNIDILAIPGHKGLMGPQGIAAIYVQDNIVLRPLMEGGTGSSSENIFQPDEMPELLESGTLNTPGIVGLGAGINFIEKIGLENIREHKYSLTSALFNGLSHIKNLHIYSHREIENNSGIFAFNIQDIDSTEVSYVLDKVYNIAVRAGLHCSPLAHKTLGTIKSGIVRISPGYFNTLEDINKTVAALKDISSSIN